LTTLVLAVSEISLGALEFKMGHVTMTTPLLRAICPPYAGSWYSPSLYKIWPL